MFFRVVALILLFIFDSFYIYKLISLNKNAIKTNQMGIGNKAPKVLIIERLTIIATILVFFAELASIIFQKNIPCIQVQCIGLFFEILAIFFFSFATITMKKSWRVGIPEEKTKLITNGIYQWSRNPAFVGFDFLYLSICLMFFNIPLLILSAWAIIMLHLQILQEEKHLEKMFGNEYMIYKTHTPRYLGLKKIKIQI